MASIQYRTELADLMLKATATCSQRKAAKAANVSPATIGNMVLGRVPSQDICKRVAVALGVSFPDMFHAAGYDREPVLDRIAELLATQTPEQRQHNIDELERWLDEHGGKTS